MTADDLSAPLGQQKRRRRTIRIPVPHIIAGSLALFLGVFVLWAVVADDPFGGEPVVVVPAHLHAPATAKASDTRHEAASAPAGADHADGAPPAQASPPQGPQRATRTVNIIDGKTGARQEIVIPAGDSEPSPADKASDKAPVDQKFVEVTPQGPIPKIAADGVRPSDAFAQPVRVLASRPDAPRIALIVAGLGVSTKATNDALDKLPGPVTLAFMPYGGEVVGLVARARAQSHEVLLQVPMEPFDYPDNDPGPQTLLTSLTTPQNIERLYTLMGRIQGYVGIINMMGARFTASEQAFAPILREAAKRGLIFVDDGSNPRSVAGRIAGANNLPFARAEVIVDSVPTPGEIDRALGRLEMMAREHGFAVGILSALPVSIAHVAKWTKAAESHGLLLVPITAIALKAKQS